MFSGRSSRLDISLNRRSTGELTGQVLLESAPGAPKVIKDWSGITLSVEGSPIEFTTDKKGNFDVDVVAEVINISASKNNFKDTRVEYITVVPSKSTAIELTLIEAWSVEVYPVADDFNVGPKTTITATFDAELDTNSVKPNTFGLYDEFNKKIPGLSINDYRFFSGNRSCRITPPTKLNYNTTYQIIITTGVKLTNGSSAIHRNWESTFTTEVGYGILEGYVTYYWSRMPLKTVKINLTGPIDYTTTTDSSGFYVIENILAGEYSLEVTLPGFPPVHEEITIPPAQLLWKNITFDEGLPIPKLWGKNLIGNKILITDNMTDSIIVDSDFTLTSNIPLDQLTVNENTVKIIEKASGEVVVYENIFWSQNRLSFIFEPLRNLKYNTTYEVIYKKEIRTYDGREIFWKDWSYCNFTTERYQFYPLGKPNINPIDAAVNVPINYTITIDFPVPMNITSVESLINTSFKVTLSAWIDKNTTVVLIHDRFEYFTVYNITLNPGMLSENGVYRLMSPVTVSFTTVSGLIMEIIGPIKDNNGKILVNVGVNIYNETGDLIKSSVTNTTGHAVFYFETKLAPGNYTLEFIKPGYDIIKMDFIVNDDGEPIIPGVLPDMKKRSEPEDQSGLLIGAIITVLILVIILIISGYFIIFKLRPKKAKSEVEQKPKELRASDQTTKFSVIIPKTDTKPGPPSKASKLPSKPETPPEKPGKRKVTAISKLQEPPRIDKTVSVKPEKPIESLGKVGVEKVKAEPPRRDPDELLKRVQSQLDRVRTEHGIKPEDKNENN